MVGKGEGAVGTLWPLFLATLKSRNPKSMLPRKSRTTTTNSALRPSFPIQFQRTINRQNLYAHPGVHLWRIRQVYSDPLLWTYSKPCFNTWPIADKDIQSFRPVHLCEIYITMETTLIVTNILIRVIWYLSTPAWSFKTLFFTLPPRCYLTKRGRCYSFL